MRERHIHVAEDSALLKTIYKRVAEELLIDKRAFSRTIIVKFVVWFSLTVIAYTALFRITDPDLFTICFMAYGFMSLLFAFNFSHDFSHNTIFKSKKLNNFCFTAIYTIVGAHAEAWKKRHVHSHHYAPNVEEYDSDLKISKLIRVIPDSKHFSWHRFQHFYAPFTYMTYSLFWVFIKDFVILFSKDEYTVSKGLHYHISFWLQKLIYISFILIIPLLFANVSWFVIVNGFLLMHFSQSLFLLFTFFMTHHVEKTHYPTTDNNGYINSSWLMNQIRSSNDMHPFSETTNFILGGFNNHIAHHLFPHIHHIHYPKLNRILYDILHENNINPNQTSYWGGIKSHLRLLKKMSVK